MSGLRHPLSGAVYAVTDEGTIRVTTDESSGLFDREGVWISGELRTSDPQMCNWLASSVYELAPRRPTAYVKRESS
jgi:hypothetical protein